MVNSDALRWNKRYLEKKFLSNNEPRSFLLETIDLFPRSGIVLDLAMGRGNNTGILINKGFTVIGVDISWYAIREAKKKYPELMAFIADLENFTFPNRSFDIILNFYYLNRELWKEFKFLLNPGGLLIVETLTQEMKQINPEIDPKYLLYENELRTAFSDWEVLSYHEGWTQTNTQHPRSVACLAARNPA